jgi:hypothetical protein
VSHRLLDAARLTTVGVTVAILSGCGTSTSSKGVSKNQPVDATSSRGVAVAFLHALEQRDVAGMRQTMTPLAQRDEAVQGGLLSAPPQLTSFAFRGVERENPRTNASPHGSIASLRYTVALTPSAGFDNDDTSGSAYGILVSESPDKRWQVAELGGCC